MVDEDRPPDSDAAPASRSAAVTKLLARANEGDRQATDALLPLVYEELRRLVDRFLAAEKHGKRGATLQPTALVHEAYLRLVGSDRAGSSMRSVLPPEVVLLQDFGRRPPAVSGNSRRKSAWITIDSMSGEPPLPPSRIRAGSPPSRRSTS